MQLLGCQPPPCVQTPSLMAPPVAPSHQNTVPLVTHLGSVGARRAGEPAGTLQPLCTRRATFTGEAAFTLGWGGGTALGGHSEGHSVLCVDVPREGGQNAPPTLPQRDWDVLGERTCRSGG